MKKSNLVKAALCGTLRKSRLDTLFRFINRRKLLTVVYHGVTRQEYDPPIWTQLPEERFCQQLVFLKKYYNIVSLDEVVRAIREDRVLPERAALITFDDGLRNNYDVAFPYLVKYGVPATIFLTMDLINTENILWFDELFFLLTEAKRKGISPPLISSSKCLSSQRKKWPSYSELVNEVKMMSAEKIETIMAEIRKVVRYDLDPLLDDFGLLSWEQVCEMKASGLVEFGCHTATHRILSTLEEKDWSKEIYAPGQRLGDVLEDGIASFCYPNGRPGIDFDDSHIDYLRESGYACAFTTEAALFSSQTDNPFRISRIPAGNDFQSNPDYFALKTSGAIRFVNSLILSP